LLTLLGRQNTDSSVTICSTKCSSDRNSGNSIKSMPTCGNKVKFKKQPDRQCACNVTLRCFRTTIFVVGKQWVLHILSVCLWPYVYSMQCACVVSFCHLKPVRLSFSKTFVWNISHSKKNSARYKQSILVIM